MINVGKSRAKIFRQKRLISKEISFYAPNREEFLQISLTYYV